MPPMNMSNDWEKPNKDPPYTNIYRQLKKAGIGKDGLLQKKDHWLSRAKPLKTYIQVTLYELNGLYLGRQEIHICKYQQLLNQKRL